MKIKIREANVKDLKDVANLQMKLLKYERKFDNKIKVGTTTSNTKYLKYNMLKKNKGKIFIALDENRIIGYCDGWIEKITHYTFNKRGYVIDCFVLKKYRGESVGSRLLKELIKWFKSKNVKYVIIDVYSKNKKAYKLWKNLGFKEIIINMRRVV